MRAVTLSWESLILTSASDDVEKDQAMMGHLFAEFFIVLNVFACANES